MLQHPASVRKSTRILQQTATALRSGRLPVVLATLLIGLSAGRAFAAYDQIGGDDVQVVKLNIAAFTTPVMDIAENGDIFVAVSVELTDRHGIYIYLSQDGGNEWSYWSRFDSTGVDYSNPSLHIAEGELDRVYVAFSYKGPSEVRRQIRVAYSPLYTPVWTVHTALSTATDDFDEPCLSSDAVNFADFKLYLAARGWDGNGNDIWFTRSTNNGVSWDAGYKIGSIATGGSYGNPVICYGRLGVVHCVWNYFPSGGTADDAVRYRRALNYAAAGLGDWEPILYITSSSNGSDEDFASVAGCHGDNQVLISYAVWEGPTIARTEFRASVDGGATWGTAEAREGQSHTQLLAYPYAIGFSASGSYYGGHGGFRSSSCSDPVTLSSHQTLADRNYWSSWSHSPAFRVQDYNTTKDNRRGLVWFAENTAGTDTVFFDAEWRRDPGYANIEAGFPVNYTSGIVAPPGICELDGDVESEIVFGTADGHIHAVNHDGSPVPGWPVDIGTFQADATIAVGSITGNSDNEVVAGNETGYIYAFDKDGVELPGWPRNMSTAAPAYVALGAVTTSSRQVVACSGAKVALYNGSGSPAPGFPLAMAGTISASPAIGDVDADGDRDIVILQQNFMDVIRGDGTVQAYRNLTTAGQTFSNAPTLADLNLDGDLEIVAPTDQGRLYVMNPNGTDFPGGWPYVDPSGGRLTSAALANMSGNLEPEIVFNVESATSPGTRAFFYDLGSLSGYPKTTAAGWFLYGMPIIDVLDGTRSHVVVATRDMDAYAWNNMGTELPGWPEHLGARCNVSAASGDIDNDGRVEVVFTTFAPAQLLVYDLGGDLYRSEAYRNKWWPMYGYNPLRQGCLACDNDRVSAVDDAPPIAAITFAAPAPNPATGPVRLSFRLPEPAAVRLDVFDTQGRLIAHVLRGELEAGPHDLSWSPRNEAGAPLAGGVYYLKLVVNGPRAGREMTRKLVIFQ